MGEWVARPSTGTPQFAGTLSCNKMQTLLSRMQVQVRVRDSEGAENPSADDGGNKSGRDIRNKQHSLRKSCEPATSTKPMAVAGSMQDTRMVLQGDVGMSTKGCLSKIMFTSIMLRPRVRCKRLVIKLPISSRHCHPTCRFEISWF